MTPEVGSSLGIACPENALDLGTNAATPQTDASATNPAPPAAVSTLRGTEPAAASSLESVTVPAPAAASSPCDATAAAVASSPENASSPESATVTAPAPASSPHDTTLAELAMASSPGKEVFDSPENATAAASQILLIPEELAAIPAAAPDAASSSQHAAASAASEVPSSAQHPSAAVEPLTLATGTSAPGAARRRAHSVHSASAQETATLPALDILPNPQSAPTTTAAQPASSPTNASAGPVAADPSPPPTSASTDTAALSVQNAGALHAHDLAAEVSAPPAAGVVPDTAASAHLSAPSLLPANASAAGLPNAAAHSLQHTAAALQTLSLGLDSTSTSDPFTSRAAQASTPGNESATSAAGKNSVAQATPSTHDDSAADGDAALPAFVPSASDTLLGSAQGPAASGPGAMSDSAVPQGDELVGTADAPCPPADADAVASAALESALFAGSSASDVGAALATRSQDAVPSAAASELCWTEQGADGGEGTHVSQVAEVGP